MTKLCTEKHFNKNPKDKIKSKKLRLLLRIERTAAMMMVRHFGCNKGCCLSWDFNMAAKLVEKSPYLANSANCFGSLKSIPGRPPGGIFFPVMYSVKSGA